uniref:Uncharacterized protein n=1 Tax=Panstrongylus lignarius TaxID=156445 RepID=A0A224Y3M0_9HEMI
MSLRVEFSISLPRILIVCGMMLPDGSSVGLTLSLAKLWWSAGWSWRWGWYRLVRCTARTAGRPSAAASASTSAAAAAACWQHCHTRPAPANC